MKALSLNSIAIAVASLFALPGLAAAQNDYVFGTSLVLISPRQLTDPNSGWWADALPMEYNSAQGTIVKAINAARQARGVTEMIDWKTYPIQLGGENVVNGQYEYNIDFQRMTPEDIEVALAQFPFEGALSDLQHEIRPLRMGYFNADSMQPGVTTLNLDLLGTRLTFTTSEGFAAARDKVAAVLADKFSGRAKFDMSWNCFTSAQATGDSFNIYITVYLDGAEKNISQGDGEGGM
jgi:hypothetical protein